ncbi:ABC transporter permease [Flavicella sediminum]|uniref:ABC transporter permease n=1 Tax=Flavicella sediminum TaxID=2585141 RepID=UPI00111DEB00|nr:ABC transporter permease [Flavicella sediminum]
MRKNKNSLSYLALQKFKQNKTGVFSFWYIVLCGFIAVFCYLIAPDTSSNANQMHLEIHSKAPGYKTSLLVIPNTKEQGFFSKFMYGKKHPATEIPISSYRMERDTLILQLKTNKLASKEIPISKFNGPIENYIKEKTYYFGTDRYGRDLLSRILIGTRISFFIGFVAVFISLILGISIGAIAGYFGGKVDSFLMWIINITWSIPTLLLVIAITLALGKGFWQVFIAVGMTMWVEVARVVRGQIMSSKKMQYVEAAKALGFSNFRIVFKHILPNIMAPIIVISAANFAASILIESGLSFLGIGAQPPTPSWGGIIKDHFSYIILGKPYLALIPGIAIMTLVMAFMLMGNALRDALDVKNNN